MSEFFQSQNPTVAGARAGGQALRGLGDLISKMPFAEVQGRETRARADLYGAQTGYYRSKQAVEEAQQQVMSEVVRDLPPLMESHFDALKSGNLPVAQESGKKIQFNMGRIATFDIRAMEQGTKYQAATTAGVFNNPTVAGAFSGIPATPPGYGNMRPSKDGTADFSVMPGKSGSNASANAAILRSYGTALAEQVGTGEITSDQMLKSMLDLEAKLDAGAVLPENPTQGGAASALRQFDATGGIPMRLAQGPPGEVTKVALPGGGVATVTPRAAAEPDYEGILPKLGRKVGGAAGGAAEAFRNVGEVATQYPAAMADAWLGGNRPAIEKGDVGGPNSVPAAKSAGSVFKNLQVPTGAPTQQTRNLEVIGEHFKQLNGREPQSRNELLTWAFQNGIITEKEMQDLR